MQTSFLDYSTHHNWGYIQQSLGEKWGTPWMGGQSVTWSHAHLVTVWLPINLTCMFLDCGQTLKCLENTY